MSQSRILLRVCCKLLIWFIIAGITTDFVASKTVTRHPKDNTEPCNGENCDHAEHQPAWEPVLQMPQQQMDPQSGTEEHASVPSDGLNIDPESLLHPVGGSHVHDGAPPGAAGATDLGGADAPDIRKELHGEVADIETGSGEVPNLEEHGPDMEATLHGGMKHVHSPVASTGDLPESEEPGRVFGVDPEEMLHGGQDVHGHGGESSQRDQNNEGNFDLGTDIDALLHGGDQHAHDPERRSERDSDAIPEVPIGASDPEAFLHDGNGQIHAHGGAKERQEPEPRPYGAADPEEMLHGSDEHHVHTVRQAMDGSRPLSGTKDPDVVGMDVNPMDIRVGTMRPEDKDDYVKWKSEKEKQGQDPSQTYGWLSGFSYIKDALLRDLEVVRKRYLPSIFGEPEEEASTDKGTSKRTHDEA